MSLLCRCCSLSATLCSRQAKLTDAVESVKPPVTSDGSGDGTPVSPRSSDEGDGDEYYAAAAVASSIVPPTRVVQASPPNRVDERGSSGTPVVSGAVTLAPPAAVFMSSPVTAFPGTALSSASGGGPATALSFTAVAVGTATGSAGAGDRDTPSRHGVAVTDPRLQDARVFDATTAVISPMPDCVPRRRRNSLTHQFPGVGANDAAGSPSPLPSRSSSPSAALLSDDASVSSVPFSGVAFRHRDSAKDGAGSSPLLPTAVYPPTASSALSVVTMSLTSSPVPPALVTPIGDVRLASESAVVSGSGGRAPPRMEAFVDTGVSSGPHGPAPHRDYHDGGRGTANGASSGDGGGGFSAPLGAHAMEELLFRIRIAEQDTMADVCCLVAVPVWAATLALLEDSLPVRPWLDGAPSMPPSS